MSFISSTGYLRRIPMALMAAVFATMNIIRYTVLNKVQGGRARETTEDPSGVLPHTGCERTCQGMAEGVG